MEERTELEAAISVGYDGSLSARAQMVLWRAEGCKVQVRGDCAQGRDDETHSFFLDRPLRTGRNRRLGGPEAHGEAAVGSRESEVENHSSHTIRASWKDRPHALVEP